MIFFPFWDMLKGLGFLVLAVKPVVSIFIEGLANCGNAVRDVSISCHSHSLLLSGEDS